MSLDRIDPATQQQLVDEGFADYFRPAQVCRGWRFKLPYLTLVHPDAEGELVIAVQMVPAEVAVVDVLTALRRVGIIRRADKPVDGDAYPHAIVIAWLEISHAPAGTIIR